MREISVFMPIKIKSERVKNKSIKKLLNRPLLNWSLSTLDCIGVDINIYTSTPYIIQDNIDFECKNINIIERPKRLDSNDTLGIEIYKEYSKVIDSNNYFLTHCTSPFVKLESYKAAIEECISGKFDSGSSCSNIKSFCYYNNKKINFQKRIKTQNLEPIISENSAFYFFKKDILNSGCRSGSNHKFFPLSKIESLDFDYYEDFELIESIKNLGEKNE